MENDGLIEKIIGTIMKRKLFGPFCVFIFAFPSPLGETFLGLQPPLPQALHGPRSRMSPVLPKVQHGILLMMTTSPNSQLKSCSTKTLPSSGKVSRLSLLCLSWL